GGPPGARRRAVAGRGAGHRGHDAGGSAAPGLAAALMAGLPDALGLVAGAGALPALMAQEARGAGWRVVALALGDPSGLERVADRVVPCRLGELAPILGVLGEEGIRHVVLAGRVWKDGVFEGAPRDAAAGRILGRARDWSDDGLLG